MAKGMGSIVDIATKLVKSIDENPQLVTKGLMYSIPGLAAMELMNLEPTGDVIGEYLKNQLVPSLEMSNVKRDIELEALKEVGAKGIPQIAKGKLEAEQRTMGKAQKIEEAYGMIDSVIEEMRMDPFIQGTDEDKLRALATDLIKIAPSALSDNIALFKSTLRAAVLSGTDSIDPSTAMTLAQLEQSMSGGL